MMMTRCPACGTAFRVTPEQLKARGGKVRCGHCNAVFNALEALADAPSPAAPAAPTPAAAPSAEPLSEPPPEALVATKPETESQGADEAETGPPPSIVEPASREEETVALDSLLTGEDESASLSAEPARHTLAWSMACLLALALLAAQAAYVFRGELSRSWPELRPLLEAMCERLECDIPLPRKAELAAIEASDLHPDPARKNLLVLAATLRNRADFAQAYPHLELTLTDMDDQPIVRKVFAPEDYLAQDADLRAGFAANAELPVNLLLDPGDSGASGYRLYLFYP